MLLSVFGNKLRKLPNNLGSLGRLERLAIQNNFLDELPENIGDLKNLTQL